MKADTDLSDLAMCMGRSTRTWLSQRMASQAYKRSLRNEGGCSMKWHWLPSFKTHPMHKLQSVNQGAN
jgi:hypothetical protein